MAAPSHSPLAAFPEEHLMLPLPICGFDTHDPRYLILEALGVGSTHIVPEPHSKPLGVARLHKSLLRAKEFANDDDQNGFTHAVGGHGDGFGEDVGEYLFHVFVRMPEKSICVPISAGETVFSLKAKIYDMEGIHPDQQRLSYVGRQLESSQPLQAYNVEQQCTIHLVLRLPGGSRQAYHLDPSIFDSQFDFDFTKAKDSGRVYTRGGLAFQRPYGCQRVGLNVSGQFPDDRWLGAAAAPGAGGRRPGSLAHSHSRAESVADEWAVSYHGTGLHHGKTMAEAGYELSQHSRHSGRFTHGVCTTPDISVAQTFAPVHLAPDGRRYVVIVQNRVNPSTITRVPKEDTNLLGEFWVSPCEDDVRPYSICVKYLDQHTSSGKATRRDKGCVIS